MPWLWILIPGGLLALLFSRQANAGGGAQALDATMTDPNAPDSTSTNAVIPDSAPRGIRNNNPFNLRPGSQWQGIAGVDNGPAGAYLIFDTPDHGLRAGFKNLRNQDLLHGLNTVREIITKYAPAADNNATGAYIAAVADELQVSQDTVLDLADNPDTLRAFGVAVIRHENGRAYPEAIYDTDQLSLAANEAMGFA